jgi:3-hydroxyisobutyrate dehydrogenase-like beta-hydroxyacid dehydrogenase
VKDTAMQIAFIGLGEAGSAFVRGWSEARAQTTRAYDIKSEVPATAPEISARCADLGIRNCATVEEAVTGAYLVFCTVTADQAVIAAQGAAAHLGQGTVWLDLNSVAPSSKRISAEVIEAAGCRYVDVAVMAPVHPKLNLVPCLLSGPHAEEMAPVLEALPMSARVIEGPVGAASSIKMIRSVMVKGLEALTAECVLAAFAAGVEEEVLGSLMKSHPGTDWPKAAAYNFERSISHGERRAAEMEEVAKTLTDLGLFADVTEGTIRWQRRLAGAGVPIPHAPPEDGPMDVAVALLHALRSY